VKLISLDDGVVRLRLLGSCHGCPSSGLTLESTIENAILSRAPDAAGIEIERAAEMSPKMSLDAKSRFTLPLVHS
jgi:Fe-S cluster biogenesis protein NfuA